jgi:hypothetical protein
MRMPLKIRLKQKNIQKKCIKVKDVKYYKNYSFDVFLSRF